MGSSYDIGVLPNLYGYVLLIIWFASVDSVSATIISTVPTKVANDSQNGCGSCTHSSTQYVGFVEEEVPVSGVSRCCFFKEFNCRGPWEPKSTSILHSPLVDLEELSRSNLTPS